MRRFVKTVLTLLAFGSVSATWAQQPTPSHSSISQIASGGGVRPGMIAGAVFTMWSTRVSACPSHVQTLCSRDSNAPRPGRGT